MKNIAKWIPNILSLSRIAVAPFIALSALDNHWKIAFILLVVGLATDWFDGALAIKLNAKSDFGAKILEPYCDFILSVGAIGGLILTHNISWMLAVVLVIIAIVAHTGTIALMKPTPLKRFCCGFMPFYYLFVILATTAIYAAKAFDIQALWLLIPSVLLGIYAIKTKQHRLKAWLRGQP